MLQQTGALDVLQVCPDAADIQDRIAQAAAGRKWRPIVVLAIDAADVPSRPETAKGTRPGRKKSRARRKRWQGEYREAKGFRFYLVDEVTLARLFCGEATGVVWGLQRMQPVSDEAEEAIGTALTYLHKRLHQALAISDSVERRCGWSWRGGATRWSHGRGRSRRR